MLSCKDHLGNEYKSIAKMCEAHGLCQEAFYRKRRKGFSLEKCLENKGKFKSPLCKPIKDHLDNEYPSKGELLRVYELSRSCFAYRVRAGWTLEECLLGKA